MPSGIEPTLSRLDLGLRDGASGVGVDVGATLIKLAMRTASGELIAETLPSSALDQVAERVAAQRPEHVGLTGGGAPRLAQRIDRPVLTISEFEAWAAGARALLALEAIEAERFLLVSVGTGTSAMMVESEQVTRVGGTALGGGTVLGLGAALLGQTNFAAIADLAGRGDRRQVDLMISDIYPEGDFMLPGEVNAASFAKLAHTDAPSASGPDLAHGIMGLVGENIGLICCGLAAHHQVERVVFGGSTVRDNPALVAILGGACLVFGRQPHFLDLGPFAGALGALSLGARAAMETTLRR